LKYAEQEYAQASVKDLRPHPKNPRQGDVGAIHESIEANGFYGAIVAQRGTGYILAGNHRYKAAVQSGAKQVPVIWLDVDEATATRVLLADNRTNDRASYDNAALAEILAELAAGPGLEGTGYDGDDLDALIADLGGEPKKKLSGDLDQVPDDAPARCKPGDLWLLGEHRLLCGDSTKPEDVARLMGGAKADACVTDPPFAIMGSSTGAKNDPSLIRPFFRMFWKAIKSTGAFDVYMFCDWRSFPTIHNEADGWDIKDVIVWDKKSGGLGNPYRRRHEFIVFARPAISDKKMMGRTVGGVSITDDDVWPCERVSDKEHNAQKPVPIVSRCIENSTSLHGVVFEPCGGSGTTLIACEQLGRKCYGMEISPQYCDVIVKRWEDATGGQAVLEAYA
jgi:DNA modification methylase